MATFKEKCREHISLHGASRQEPHKTTQHFRKYFSARVSYKCLASASMAASARQNHVTFCFHVGRPPSRTTSRHVAPEGCGTLSRLPKKKAATGRERPSLLKGLLKKNKSQGPNPSGNESISHQKGSSENHRIKRIMMEGKNLDLQDYQCKQLEQAGIPSLNLMSIGPRPI